MFNLSNKVSIITGGGSGIGKAVALLFSKNKAIVHVVDLDKTLAEETVRQIKATGMTAYAHSCNVTKQEETKTVVREIIKVSGRIDIVVNCAGIAHIGRLDNTTEEDFDKVYQVNVKGTYNVMLATIDQMVKQNSGVILNLASIASSVGLSDRFAYSMSKGAVLAMTFSVAKDYVKNQIRCNCISPARIHTPFVDNFIRNNYPGHEEEMFDKLSKTQPVGRMGKPEEVATLALYLCSDEASFITGSDYPIDGGFIKLNT
jgi:2-keto-3-deoxy-L-fuconate dehydrogenase